MPIAADVILGNDVKIIHPDLVNLYGCKIGAGTQIGTFVEIQSGAVVGERCKIQSHTFICDGTVIEDEVFIGHGVVFINDRLPLATLPDGMLRGTADWKLQGVHIGRRASIGSHATILCGVRIGVGALVGAGSVVTNDVPDATIVVGNPAYILRKTTGEK